MNEKFNIFNISIRHIITVLLLISQYVNADTANTELSKRYSKENPVVVVSDWEHAPYQFLDDNANSGGYCVEVVNMILDELKLPYKNIFGEWHKVLPRFWDPANKRNLTLQPKAAIARSGLYYSQSAVLHYRLGVISHINTKEIKRFDELPKEEHLVFLKKRDYGDAEAKRRGWTYDERQYMSTDAAINYVATNKNTYFVWGYDQLNRLQKEGNIPDLRITPLIDVRYVPVVFASYDKELIRAIDYTYETLLKEGKFDALYTKYFDPDALSERTSPYVVYSIIFISALIIALMILTFIMLRKYRKNNFNISRYNEALEAAMETSIFEVYIYDIKQGIATQVLPNQSKQGQQFTLQEYFAHVPEEYHDMVQKTFYQLIEGKIDSTTFNYRWKDSVTDKNNRDIKFYVTSIKDKKNIPTKLIVATKDITEDILEDNKRTIALEQYKQMFDSSFFGLTLFDKDGNYLDINIEGIKNHQAGLMKSEDMQSNLFSYPIIISYYNKRSTEPFSYCKIVEKESGEKAYFEIGVQAMLDDDGNPMYYAVSSLNITEERKQVVELQKLETNITNTTEKLRLYEEQLSELLIRNNAWMYVYDIHDNTFRFFRRHNEPDYILESHEYYNLIDENYWIKNTQDAITNCDRLKELCGEEYTAIYRALSFIDRNDNKYHYYINHGLPKTLANGKITGTYGIIQDVTERYELEEQLKKDTEKALRAGQAKSAFLASMSHEIRTPLNSIVGFSSMLKYMEDNNERNEAVKIIQDNSEMLMRIISDIQIISDLDKGVFEIKPREVDFTSIFVRTAQSLAQQFNHHTVQFSYENPYETMPVFIDIDRIMQVLVNFTTNARKHTVKGHIKIGYKRKDGGIYVYCEDTGTGIPDNKHEAVFDRFVKLDEYIQGTGLGLYICKSIATSLGGKIGVESKEGEGSTFWLWVPEADKASAR